MSKFPITRRSPTFHIRFRHGGINALYPLYCHTVQSQILPFTMHRVMASPKNEVVNTKNTENIIAETKINGSPLTIIWEAKDDNILTFPQRKKRVHRIGQNPRPKTRPDPHPMTS